MLGIAEILISVILAVVVFLLVASFVNYVKVKKSGIGYFTPVPIFGNLLSLILRKEHMAIYLTKICNTFSDDRYVALIEAMKTTIVIKDTELIKQIYVKDFDSFQDLPFDIDENIEPVFGRIILFLKGKKWRQMKAALTPIFTSAKIKNMYSIMINCSMRVVDYFEKNIQKSDPKTLSLDVEMGDVSKRYTSDILASSAFSFDINSMVERDNEFFKHAEIISKQNLVALLKLAGFRLFPNLMKILSIRLLSESRIGYFRKLLFKTLKTRKETNEQRPDLIHLLLEAQKGTLKQEILEEASENFSATKEIPTVSSDEEKQIWTDDDLIAQAVMFILAGHGSSSTTLSCLFYELALHPDVQDKLYEEIESVLNKNDGKINYTNIMQMKYMDMVVSETLRKWPPIPFTNRKAAKSYNLGPISKNNERCYEVQKGDGVWISIYSVHMDEQNWEKPEVFDPERFSDENKPNIKPYSFIPFGAGPRNCIGSRFALLQIKLLTFFLLAKFSYEPCPKTMIPIKLVATSLFLEPVDGFWVNMKLRKNSKLDLNTYNK